jgi:hypothetical protein
MLSSTCEPAALDELERPAEVPSRAPVRVLHVVNGEHYSGAERVQDLLALNLAEFGFDVGFACLKPGRFDQMRQAKRAPLADLHMRSRVDLLPALRLARLITNQKYALVHTHSPRAALAGRLASALAGVPLVHHVHSHTASDWTRMRQNRLNGGVRRHHGF